jgi:spermidine synthase
VSNCLALCVLFSGFSALIYEVTWQRVLVRLLGEALPAATIVISVFMTGIAIGAFIAGRLADKVRDPLKLFSWVELGLGAFGLFFPLLVTQSSMSVVLQAAAGCVQTIFHVDPILAYATAAGELVINILLTASAAALLILPTIAMGTTLPLAARAVAKLFEEETHEHTGCGARISRVYMLNLVGASSGCIASAFFLLPWVGIADTIRAAAGLNLITSLVLLFTHRLWLMSVEETAAAEVQEQSKAPAPSLASISEAVKEPALTAVAQTPEEPKRAAAPQTEIPPVVSQPAKPFPKSFKGLVRTNSVLYTFAGLSAAIAIGLQITWTRLFTLVFGSSTYAVAAVIACCLIGLAAGSAISTFLLKLKFHRFTILAITTLVASLLVTGTLFGITTMPLLLVQFQIELAKVMSPFAVYFAARVLLIAALVVPEATVLGIVTPYLLGQLADSSDHAGSATGKLLFATTFGSIFGGAIAGCVLIPHLVRSHTLALFSGDSGIQNTLILLALTESGLAAAALLLYMAESDSKRRGRTLFTAITSVACAISILAVNAHPEWQPAVVSCGGSNYPLEWLQMMARNNPRNLREFLTRGAKNSTLVFYREGNSTTVTVDAEQNNNIVRLRNDGKVEAALPIDVKRPSPGTDLITQVLLGALPTLICPVKPENAFVIGYGSGTTSGALLNSPDIKSVKIAELEPAVYKADPLFHQINNRPLRPLWRRSDRVVPISADARNLLALSHHEFSIIASQPAEPWTNGSADLYSLEFWRLAKDKLVDHGVFCQWLQLYAIDTNHLAIILRTFSTVFPNTMLFHSPRAGELILVGFENDADKLDTKLLTERLSKITDREQLSRVGIDTTQDVLDLIFGVPESVKTFCVAEESQTKDGRINSDNNLLTEFLLPGGLPFANGTAEDTIEKNLAALRQVTPTELLASYSIGSAAAYIPSDQAEKYLQQAQVSLRAGSLVQALHAAAHASQVSPTCAKCQKLEGVIHMQMQQFAEAASAFTRSLAIDPNQFAARTILGEALLAKGNEEQGLKELVSASTVRPDRFEPLAIVAAYLALKGDFNLAELNWKRLQKRAPNAWPTAVIGYYLAENGAGKENAPDLVLALKRNGKSPSMQELKNQMQAMLKATNYE